jgi:hypothetical protein
MPWFRLTRWSLSFSDSSYHRESFRNGLSSFCRLVCCEFRSALHGRWRWQSASPPSSRRPISRLHPLSLGCRRILSIRDQYKGTCRSYKLRAASCKTPSPDKLYSRQPLYAVLNDTRTEEEEANFQRHKIYLFDIL